MLDKISKILYFIFIIITTYIVITTAEVTKIESFIEDQLQMIQESEQSDLDLIQTVSLTYSNKKNDAYIYKEPLFKETYEYKTSSDELVYTFELVFYKYVEVNKNKYSNSLAIIINELEINDSSLFLTDREQPVIDLDIDYDKSFDFKNNTFSSSIERFQPYEGLNSYILLINYDFLKGKDDGYVNFKTMNFKYRVIGDDDTYKPLLTLYNNELYDNNDVLEIKDDLTFINRDISPLSSDNIVFNNVDLSEIKTSNDFYFNAEVKKTLSKKNFYYFKYLGIELLIVLVVTYALFLHKDVMILVKNKKIEKRNKIEEIKKEIRKEEEKK